MSGNLVKEKLKASAIHLSISIVLFFGILYLILVEWYPGVFFEAEGGWSGIKLMAMVDLVLGPSLTFIVFNHTKTKKAITFDLSLIAFVQLVALIWGGAQVYFERPVALVMWEGVFYTVTEDYYKKQNISLDEVKTYSDEKPLLIFADTDHSVAQLKEISLLVEQGVPPYAQVQLYQPVKRSLNNLFKHQISDEVISFLLKKEKVETKQHVFYGKAKYRNLLIHLDDDAQLIGITIRQ